MVMFRQFGSSTARIIRSFAGRVISPGFKLLHSLTRPDDCQFRRTGSQPQLGARPSDPIPARYRFLQVADAAVYLEALSEDAGIVLALQPHHFSSSRRSAHHRGIYATAGACEKTAIPKIRTGLAGWQHVLRPPRNFRARIPGMAGA